MILTAKTDIGLHRESNQDAFDCGNFSDGATWAVVCDGMGGVSGGQIAGSLCVEKVSDNLKKGYRSQMTLSSLKNLLISSVNIANTFVFEQAQKELELKGMGTTVVAVVVVNGICVIAHVGDSRAYLINDNITALTKDHSLVEYMIDTGKITRQEAKTHPDRNVITRAVGTQSFVDVDINITDISPDDKLLICTDGFSGVIDDDEILQLISKTDTDAEKLIKTALDKGSRDNVTVVIMDGRQGE